MYDFFALHGFAASPDHFTRLRPFFFNCEIEAPWLLGHGPRPLLLDKAKRANDQHSYRDAYEQEVDRLRAMLKPNAQEKKRYLLGYSMGARMSLGLLSRLGNEAKQYFNGIILIAPNPGIRELPSQESVRSLVDSRRQWDEMWARRLETQGIMDFERAWSQQDLFRTQASLDELTQAAVRKQRLSHDPLALAQACRILGLGHMPNYWPLLKKLKLPVLYIVGALDHKFIRICAEAAGQTALARLVEIPECGHNPLLEDPETVAQSISQWIDQY